MNYNIIGIIGIILLSIGIMSFMRAVSSIADSIKEILKLMRTDSQVARKNELYKIFAELHALSLSYQNDYTRELMSIAPDVKKMDEAETKSNAVEECIKILQKYAKNKSEE